MPSPPVEQAIIDAQHFGRAILKFISPNDVGLTGSHQFGYYLPKAIWSVFTSFRPTKGANKDHRVHVLWQDGRETASTVKWYGTGTRSEYRLTGFNRERHFPFISQDCVGSLLVLIPEQIDRFRAYVFDLEDEIEDFQAGLGVEVVGTWALYDRNSPQQEETEDECLSRRFRAFAGTLTAFPPTTAFATEAREALLACIRDYLESPVDEQLLRAVETEYSLFRIVERKLVEPEIIRIFRNVEDFLSTAQTILQRRKSRAGRSLENHVETQLKLAGIPFDVRIDVDGTKPDVLIPGRKEYLDKEFPVTKLFAVGVKTTCKDRWRQVTREAPRVRHKHILTVQKGVSPNQLDEMNTLNVTLIVPKGLHREFPKDRRDTLMTVEEFIDRVKDALAH